MERLTLSNEIIVYQTDTQEKGNQILIEHKIA